VLVLNTYFIQLHSSLLHFDISVAVLQVTAQLFLRQHFVWVVFSHYAHRDVVLSELSVLGGGAEGGDAVLD